MALPHHIPDDPNVQRVEMMLSDEQYLTVMIRPDERHGKQIDVSLFQQTPHVEGVEQEILELLSSVNLYGDGTVFVVLDKTDHELLTTEEDD
jgi:pyridoxine 5'-phosphate synthase PdxJ